MRLWIIFGTMFLSMIVSRLNITARCADMLQKNFTGKNVIWNTNNFILILYKADQSKKNQNFRQVLPIFRTHTEHRLIVWYTSECKNG
jgi:hypothetical protein